MPEPFRFSCGFLKKEIAMSANDQNVKPEQRAPRDVHKIAENPEPGDDESVATPAVQPAGAKDKSERPIVNPVTGGAL
jgi:hypothetical protein